MAYTHPVWHSDQPAPSDLASQGATNIDDFKLDIKERVESVFDGIDSNPWQLKDNVLNGSGIKDGTLTIDKFDVAMNVRSILLGQAFVTATINNGVIGSATATVVGAEPGDMALCSWADGRFIIVAAVTAQDTVTIAIGNWTAAPITLTAQEMFVAVIKAGPAGQLHGSFTPMIPSSEFQPSVSSVTVSYAAGAVAPSDLEAITLIGTLVIPVGQVITGVSVRLANNDANAVASAEVFRVFDGGGPTSLATLTSTPAGGTQTIASGALAQTVAEGDRYVWVVTLDTSAATNANDAQLFWAKAILQST